MGRYLVRRLLQIVPLLFILSFGLFWMMNSIGDPLSIFAEKRPAPTGQQAEEMRRRLGLDKPIYWQYITWLIGNDWQLVDVRGDGTLMQHGTRLGVLRGDWGLSFVTKKPAFQLLSDRLPNTLILMLPQYLIVVILALSIGMYSALHQYTRFDSFVTSTSLILYSIPIFLISLLAIYFFGIQFSNWGLPPLPFNGTGDGTIFTNPLSWISHLILPTMCLVVIQVGGYIRYVRSSMLDVMGQDYIRTARAKGVSENQVVLGHVLKNAALPLVTLLGTDLPLLLTGAVVTERIFGWPGMGQLFIQSLDRSDYNVLMAILMVASLAVILFQLFTDIAYTWLDPRIRYS
ncbi:MAG TPA: ABC transporter permease [Aggregatilineales bacterium]|nr:ABC transporter permease [Aggregatilineales bacterium]